MDDSIREVMESLRSYSKPGAAENAKRLANDLFLTGCEGVIISIFKDDLSWKTIGVGLVTTHETEADEIGRSNFE